MKRFLSVLAAALLLATAAGSAQQRETYNINRGWKFFSDRDVSSDKAQRVNLPHTWNNDALSGRQDYYRGIGNYLKQVDIPRNWQGRRVFLRSHGSSTVCNLFVNGKHVGEHKGAYAGFVFEITDFIQPGSANVLWLLVNNSPRENVMPIAGEYTYYGGLFRDVELVVTAPVAIAPTDFGSEGVYVKQKKVNAQRAECEIEVRVGGTADANASVRVTVCTPQGDTVADRSSKVKLNGRAVSTATIPIAVDNPRLWNGAQDPFLYEVTAEVESGGKTTDRVTVSTGFRSLAVDAEGHLLLNDVRYPVRGVVATQDRAAYGPALISYDVEEDFSIIREIGANAVRVSGGMHHPDFYRLCDREGILVWNDFPVVGAAYPSDVDYTGTDELRTNGQRQAEEIVRQLYNHPSVAMWGLFSDITLRGDDPTGFLTSLNTATKRIDPSRLTAASSRQDGELNFIPDLIVWNHIFGWHEGRPADVDVWRRHLHSNWRSLPSAVSYGAGGSIRHQTDTLARPDYRGNWHPERWQTHLHEEYFRYLAGDTLFWGLWVCNLFEYGAVKDKSGEGSGINDKGLVTFDRKFRKDAFYLYKANWNPDDKFVYIAEKRWDQRRSATQQIRVYTNCEEAELLVNGVSRGTKKAEGGIAVWENVPVTEGRNTLEARSGEYSDRARIEIVNSASGVKIN